MAEEKEKIEKEQDETRFDNNYLSESYTKKFIKTGLLAIGASILFKGKSKNDELLRIGTTAAATMALSKDNDYSKDAIVLASLFGVKNAVSLGKVLALSDFDNFQKVYKYAEKADDISKNFKLASMNFSYKAIESVKKNAAMYIAKNQSESADSESIYKTGVTYLKAGVHSLYKTIKDSYSFVKENGLSESLKELNNNNFYNTYQKFNQQNKIKELEILAHDIQADFGLNIKEFDVNRVSAMVDDLLTMVIPDRLYQSKLEMYQKGLKELKIFKKFQRIEESSFFTDMLGMYTKLDDGKLTVKMDKILDDKMNFIDGLETLADNFKRTARLKDAKKFDNLSDETKTEMFIDYLNKNGFSELVEKAYKKDELINFQELNKMMEEQSNGLDDFIYTARKSSLNFIEKTADDSYEIKNFDILKNFAVTNVVKKSTNGFLDETALNGHINFMRTLGALEKNVVSTFKIPILDKTVNLWNPFRVIESDARIKNEITNNIMGFYYNNKGYMLNKMYIYEGTKKATKINVFNKEITKNKDYEIATYFLNPKREAKVIFNKSLLAITNESYKVSNDAQKTHKTFFDILTIAHKKGIKKGLEAFSNSHLNPFVFRYNTKNGFYKINSNDGYFKEGTIFSKYFNKTDIEVSAIRAENQYMDEYVDGFKKGLADKLYFYDANYKDSYIVNVRKEMTSYLKNIISDFKGSNESEEMLIKNIDDVAAYYAKSLVSVEESLSQLNKIIYFNSAADSVDKNFLDNLSNYAKAKYSINYLKRSSKNISDLSSEVHFVNDFIKHNIVNQDSAVGKAIDNYFTSNFISNEEFIDFYKHIKNVVKKYDEINLDLDKHVNDLLHKKHVGYYNFIDDYNVQLSIKNEKNIFNPIYEILKGKEINKFIKEYGIDDEFVNMSNKYHFLVTEEMTPKFFRTLMEDVKFGFKNIINNQEFHQREHNFGKKYKIYDEIEEFVATNTKGKDETIEEALERTKQKPFDEIIEDYNKIKYKDYQNKMTSSTIIRSTEFNHKNLKEVLNNVKEGIYNLISNKKINEAKELDSQMNLLSKIAISKLQDALESISIERLPQEELGYNGVSQVYNFMKKRYIPLYVMFGGAIAADTFSDAIVPDDVPIIGNGISGVAVKGVAASRIGLQYMLQGTGILSIMRGMENAVPGLFNNAIGDSLDILMSPSEMIDIYFRGKPIEVKDNRWWFTAGRQSGQGEEFKQYRPHLWYIWQNKDSGIYSNKFEKLFRRDFLPTSLGWYLLDPYKEEREAYEKYGAVYPMTEQLFTQIPVIGNFLNATIGEVIKPTQYIGEERWRVGDDMMLNPNYNPNDPSSPKYIKFNQPNKLVKSVFETIEDLKTFAGIQGYGVTKISELLFGASNPYQNEVALSSIDQDTGLYARYDRLQLGDLFGVTEPIRRLADDSNALGMIKMNPLEQKLPDWMPEFFKHGNNPYLSWDFGNYILPSREFERNKSVNSNDEELNKFRVLSLIAPESEVFEQLKHSISKRTDTLSDKNLAHYYESLSFAQHYGKREYLNKYYGKAKDIQDIQLKIDKKISPYEFISQGKRYKLDSVTDDFNKLSERYGKSKATRMIKQLDNMFKEGQIYSFKMSQDASYSVGIDKDGDYFKIDSEQIGKRYNLEKSSYRRNNFLSSIFKMPFGLLSLQRQVPSTMGFEKIFGIKDPYTEWSTETVQAPFFRDWDTPVSSFLEPIYTYSSNYFTSSFLFSRYANNVYLNSNASFDLIGTLNKLGTLKLPFNKHTGNITKSSQYEAETRVHDELEKIKFIAGDKSFYNMTGKENLKQFSNMVNEQDAEFLEDLANVSNKEEREKILNSANERLSTVLKTIWNRHQMAVNNTLAYGGLEQQTFDTAINVGAYYGNPEETRNMIKSKLGITLSKLDAKRQGIFNAYRGTESEREGKFIADRMYRQYNVRPTIMSTIYSHGIININQRRREQY